MNPPALASPSNTVTSYPNGTRSRATVSDASPAPMQAMYLPFGAARDGMRFRTSSFMSAATRLRRQMATGSGCAPLLSSARPRRHAGSHGLSHVRPRIPGKTFDTQFTM